MSTDINSDVFDNISDLTMSRIAAATRRVIELYEPRVQVLAVDVEKEEEEEGTTLIVNLIYRVNGQTISQQIPIGAL